MLKFMLKRLKIMLTISPISSLYHRQKDIISTKKPISILLLNITSLI